MKKLLYYFGQWLTVRFCIHENKTLIYPDLQERCNVYQCDNCCLGIYEDTDHA